jgi:chemotaxis family two-component system sensor kinase Cph1
MANDRILVVDDSATFGLRAHELRASQIELPGPTQEPRQIQQERDASRRRYFDLFDLAPVAYFVLSERGLILEANQTAAKLLGVKKGELVRQPLSRFVHRDDQVTYYKHREALFEPGASETWELRMLKKNAAPFCVRVEATTTQEVDGSCVCRTVVSDISESKRAENALRTTNGELQDFVYALMHDIQDPLRTVVNFTQLLAEEHVGKLGEEADQCFTHAVEGALRMDALVKGLLNYWKVTERGADGLSPVDCNHALSEALVSLQIAIQKSGATVTSDPLPAVIASEVMLTQLFQNLIGNSIKYRGDATPKIHISTARTAGEWLFSVRDNGIGIEPAHAERVFGMFKRLHGRDTPGTGIGLALCKTLVERHAGRIWVESEAGRGAVFKFTIPAGAAPLTA